MEKVLISEYLVLAIFILGGVFALVASVLNFDWFFNSRKAETFVGWFGRTGARVFYGLVGLALIASGIVFFIKGNTL